MSRSDRDSNRRNRALPAEAASDVESSVVSTVLGQVAPDSDASHSADLHDHFGNAAVSASLDGAWSDGLGPVISDGLDFASEAMGASEEVGVSPSNSVMLAAMRDAFQATNYDAGNPILNSLRPTGGEKLPDDVRAQFESAMGHDLGHVRIHRDATAASQSDALNAYAFTIGSHIWFGGGRFDPGTVRGKQLLAHELTHVKQHDEGRINPHAGGDGLAVSSPNDPLEVEAYAAEASVAGSLPSLDELATDAVGTEVDVGAQMHAAPAESSAQAESSSQGAAVLREENPHQLEPLHGDSGHELSTAVIEEFRQAAAEVRAATGHDISKGLGDSTRPLGMTTNKTGASNWSWHKTGRAFDINQNLPWVITEEPANDRMYFRLYLMVRGNANGAPTVQFSRNGEPALYHNGVGANAYRRPFIDVTAVLEKYGWSRIPAHDGYSKRGRGYNKQEWWHYEQRGENTWYEALDEVYDQDEIRDGLEPLSDLRGAENRMRREGVPEEEIRRLRASRNASGPAPRQLNVAPPANSKGSPLPAAVSDQLRTVLGDAVDQVRVHNGREAAAFATNLNANAVTVGTDVFFNAGRLDISSEEGLKILAEEVHHAVMGGGAPGVSQPNDPHELQAKGFAEEFAEGLQAAGGLNAAVQNAAQQGATPTLPSLSSASSSLQEMGDEAMSGVQDTMSTALGSVGLSLNAAGPLPTEDPSASNRTHENLGSREAASQPTAPVESRSPSNANQRTMSLGGGTASAGGSGAGASTGGAGQAPQATTPKEPVTGAGTQEHAQLVADAVPSLKAASYASTATSLDGHAQTEGGELHESIPEFNAVLTEDGVVETTTEAASVQAPDATTPETSETGVVETPDIEPTVDPGEFSATANTAAVSNLSEEAPEAEREQAVSQAIRSIQTEDGDIEVSPGAPPRVVESGDTDPARADRDRDSFVNQATTAGSDARQAILDSPGAERVVPLVMNEAYRVEALELGSITGMEAVNPEVQKLLDSTVSGDVITSFDEFESPRMEASHQAFEDEVRTAVEARDTDAQTEIDTATTEADQLVAEANAEQQATVAEQRGLIEAERQRTIDAGQAAMSEFNAEARAEHARVSGEVRGEIARANNQVSAEYARAEADATREVTTGEAEAQRRQAEAEREQEDQSWWQKAADWVADQLEALAEAISNIFNAIRHAVTAILDAVKELATSIIDAAVSFICTALEAFGEFLKAGIDLLVGSFFPELADALNQFVDAGVTWAQESVTALGEQLKAGIDALVSAVTDAMNAIIDAFNAAVQGALAVLQAVVTGDWVQILMALLEAALRLCGISPDEFYGLVGQAEETIDILVNNPGQFLGNLIEAVGAGFGQFADNFMTHLQNGFMEWLGGQAGDAGMELIESFDLKGLIGFGLQLLGLTYDNVRAKAVEHFGEEVVEQAEFVVDFLDTILEQGMVEGLWAYIEGGLDGVWDAVIGGLQEWIAETIIRKAVIKIASMFNPVGAIVQALLTAWDLYSWVKDNVQQIYAVVTSVVSNIHAIAIGAIGGAADMIEGALGSLVPVAIDLLAKVLGLGDVGEKVGEFLVQVQEPINDGLDTAFAWLSERVDSVADFITGGPEEEDAQVDSAEAAQDGDAQQEDLTRPKLNGGWGTPSPILYAYRSPEGDQITPLRAHGTFALEITDQASFETQWKRGEAWDNAGLESFIRSQVVSQFTPIVANANAAVPDVAAPNVYAGYGAATKSGVNNNLTGHGVRVTSVSINSISLNGGETSDLEEETGEGLDNQAFLEARQGFQADGHQHHTWIAAASGQFTVMVASTPVSGVTLLQGWQGQLNTNEFDNEQRSIAATALREGLKAITSLEALESNLKNCTDDASRAQVEGVIRQKQGLIKTHVGAAFEIFGDDAERNLEWALQQPENVMAAHKWDQVLADVGRVSGLAGVLPTFTTGVEAHLLRAGAFDEAGLFTPVALMDAMRSVVAAGPTTYLLRGDPIPASAIVGQKGLGRVLSLRTVFDHNYIEAKKKAFLDALKDSKNETAKSDPGRAWAYEAAVYSDAFDEQTDMVGETQGRVPEGWWFALKNAQGIDLDVLREKLTLTDRDFEAGFVKLSFHGDSFIDKGFQLFKPTAFDGMHQGWEDEPMWASTGTDATWGLTKSVNPVKEGVAAPISVSQATRELVAGRPDAAYDKDADETLMSVPTHDEVTEPDYLQWLALNNEAAATYRSVNQTYMDDRSDRGFTAARSRFRNILTATGWDFGNTEFVTQWNRYLAHNEHVGWDQHRLQTTTNPAIAPDDVDSAEYTDLGGVGYVQQEGEDHAVSDEDVEQGGLGDCYLIAGMAAVARDKPDLIQQAVSDNGDGTYDVTLYDTDGKAVTQTVDGAVPTKNGRAAYASPTNANSDGKDEVWPLMIEKAYANMGGGYGPIEGGWSGAAVQAITGKDYRSMMTDNHMDDGEVATFINEQFAEGNILTTGTKGDDRYSDEDKELMDEYQVYANHAYSFRSVDESTGMVHLRNPWGSSHPKPMPMDIYRRLYGDIDINDMSGD